MTLDEALAALRETADPARAAQMARYHKIDRPYLGLSNEVPNALAQSLRQRLTLSDRLTLAADLWATDMFEARITAAKLLVQARIKPEDESTWELIQSWLPDFDSWAIADAVAMAGQRRLKAEPARLNTVERWTTSDHLWTKRAALTFTLVFTKSRHPDAAEAAARTRILGWCAAYAEDPEWFIQKAVAWWLRDLSKRDPETVKTFLDGEGQTLKAFARKEASKFIAN